MHLKIGDIVDALDSTLKGEVVKIDGDTIFVETNDNMVFPFEASKLVKSNQIQDELMKSLNVSKLSIREKLSEVSTAKKLKVKENYKEVDLHIEKLISRKRKDELYNPLNTQLSFAEQEIKNAIYDDRISKIIFIHGVGKGVLKGELQILLKKYGLKFYDAPYKKYGLGAIEVCFNLKHK